MKVRNMPSNLSILDRLFYTTIRLAGVDDKDNELFATAFFFNHRKSGKDLKSAEYNELKMQLVDIKKRINETQIRNRNKAR